MHDAINVVSGFTGVLFSLSCEEALMYYSLIYNVHEPRKKIDAVIKATNIEDARKLEVEDFVRHEAEIPDRESAPQRP